MAFDLEGEVRKGRYRFVESIDPADGHHYRYVGAMESRRRATREGDRKAIAREDWKDIPDVIYLFARKEPIDQFMPLWHHLGRYLHARRPRTLDRGGSIKVIDLQTNEVIAERMGYMMDRGLGSTAGFRSPWGDAPRDACPAFSKSQGGYLGFAGNALRRFLSRSSP